MGEGLVLIRPSTSGFAAETEGKLNGLLGGIGGPVAVVAATVVALGATVFAVGEKFQGAFNQIRVGTGATGAALDGLDASFKKVLAGTAGSFEQVSTAISEISVRTGLTGSALEDFAKKEVTLGRITKTDVGQNVKDTTALFNLYGVAADQQSGKLDVLFKASQVAGVSISDLTSQVQAATPVAKALGLTFDQTAALTANLAQAGLPAQKVMQGLGKEFTAAAKAGKDPLSVISDIEDQIKKAPNDTAAAEIAFQKFGIKAGPQLSEALRSGKFDLTATLATITNGQGGINATGLAVSTLGSKFSRLKNEILVALEPAGTALVRFANEGLGKIVAYMPTLIAAVGQGIDFLVAGFKNPGLLQGPKNFLDVIFDVGAVIRRVFDGVKTAIADFARGFQGLSGGGALGVFGALVHQVFDFIEAHAKPILIGLGVVILALTSPISLIIGSLVLLYTHFQSIRDAIAIVVAYVQEVFPKVVEAVTHVMNVVRDVISVAVAAILVFWHAFGDQILTVIQVAFEQIRNIVETVIRIIAATIKLVLDIINGDWGKAWQDIKDIASAALDYLVASVENGLKLALVFFVELPGKILGALASLAGDLGGVILSALAAMLQSGLDHVGDLIGFFEGLPGKLVDALGKLSGILYNAGKEIMNGLKDGIVEGFKAVAGYVGSIAGKIADLKGPLDYDKKLLIPAGHAIMDGLGTGLKNRQPALERQVGEITQLVGGIGGTSGRAGSRAGGSSGGVSGLGTGGGVDGLDYDRLAAVLVAALAANPMQGVVAASDISAGLYARQKAYR